jgi:ABC-type multidrug transport system ATPase subunit
MIEASHLSYSYFKGEEVLRDVSFSLPSEGLYYFVGPSGCGKSTLLKILGGILTDYQGSLKVNGKEMKGIGPKEKSRFCAFLCSFSYQDDLPEEDQSVYEALKVPLLFSDVSSLDERIAYVSKIARISGLLDKKIRDLSGGEKKRVSLARAFVKDVPLYILDEPLGPLDALSRQVLTEYFKKLSEHRLVLIVTHSLNEIRKDDSVFLYRDRSFVLKGKKKKGTERPKAEVPKKKGVPFTYFFSSVIRTLIRKKRRSFFSLFASSLALISLGLISLFSTSLSEGIAHYLSSSLEENTVEAVKKTSAYASTSYTSCSYGEVKSIAAKYPSDICGVGTYFALNYEEEFPNANEAYFMDGNVRLSFAHFSIRTFAEFVTLGELEGDVSSLFYTRKLQNDEVSLLLSLNDFASFSSFLGIPKEDGEAGMDAYLIKEEPVLHLKVANASFRYEIELLFRVKEVRIGKKSRIVHSSPLFFENVLLNEMQFSKTDTRDGPFENPWTVYGSYTLLLRPGKKRKVLNLLKSEEKYDSYSFHLLGKEEFPDKCSDGNYGSIEVLNEYEDSMKFSRIFQIYQEYAPLILSAEETDSFYYSAPSLSASGFLKPVYASKDKTLLNQIADYQYEAQFDLDGFQGATIVYQDGVLMGDLSQSVKHPLRFSLFHEEDLILGRAPKDSSEVVLSSNAAVSLFGSAESSLNRKLYFTCLKETKYLEGSYKNIFADGEATVRGVIRDEENFLYQDPFFLSALAEDQFGFTQEELRIENVHFRFREGSPMDGILNDLSDRYPEYRFSLPVKKIKEGIEEIASKISDGLRVFSVISSFIAVTLMTFVLLLLIKEDLKKVRTDLLLGFSADEIRTYYSLFCYVLSFLSFLESSAFLTIFQVFFRKELEQEIGMSMGAFYPRMYLETFLLSFFIASFSAFFVNGALSSLLKEYEDPFFFLKKNERNKK